LRVIKGHKIIEDDWQLLEQLDNDQELPEGKIIFPFEYWLANRDRLMVADKQYAVWVNGDHETGVIARDLDYFELIALDFPAFTDGRSYSHARLLRERYGFSSELRAVGEVLRDQLFFMQRCGIDSFQLKQDKDMKDALRAFTEFSVKYQTAADQVPPVYKLR
jgi:uncharacterized protein (DUF934 family)